VLHRCCIAELRPQASLMTSLRLPSNSSQGDFAIHGNYHESMGITAWKSMKILDLHGKTYLFQWENDFKQWDRMDDPCSQLVLNELYCKGEVHGGQLTACDWDTFMESYHVISMARWPFGCVSTRKDHPLEFFNCLHWPVAIFQNISRLWYCSYCSSHPKIEQHRHRLYGKVHQCYST
jgi:hypothetical protein